MQNTLHMINSSLYHFLLSVFFSVCVTFCAKCHSMLKIKYTIIKIDVYMGLQSHIQIILHTIIIHWIPISFVCFFFVCFNHRFLWVFCWCLLHIQVDSQWTPHRRINNYSWKKTKRRRRHHKKWPTNLMRKTFC